jgi:hypothetical protein
MIPTEPIGSIPRPQLIHALRTGMPRARLGTTDDCGFAPLVDAPIVSRDTAFTKVGARVAGAALAILEGHG